MARISNQYGNKEYLGDSVYVEHDGWAYILTTDNGMGANNTVILEPEVAEAFIKYFQTRERNIKKED